MTRLLPPILTPDSIGVPEPMLRSLVLDGALLPVGCGYQPVDLPTTPALRAASLAPRIPPRPGPRLTVLAGRTAAWVWGGAPTLDEPLTVAVRPGRGMPPVDQPGAHLHRITLADDDLVRLGGLLVTTPLRTATDLLRADRSFDPALVVRLLEECRLEPALVRRALAGRRRARGRRVALARLQLLFTR